MIVFWDDIIIFNRHMEQRIFGRELTNLLEGDALRYKRNHSFLHAERPRDYSLALKQPLPAITKHLPANNRSLPEAKKVLPKL